jgi:ribose 5-phosphate isomerase
MTDSAYLPGGCDDPSVHAVAAKAIELIPDGARVGLGSGRAASAFIATLGARRRDGLRVSGVPTSQVSADEARRAGIPLIELGEGGPLDLTVDGADEVAPNLDLVKGWGGRAGGRAHRGGGLDQSGDPRRRGQARSGAR